MRSFTPEEIRRAVRGRWRWPAGPVAVKSVSTDTRTAGESALFVALRGNRFDGHSFLDKAASIGCITAVVDQSVSLDDELIKRFQGGVIGVPDTTVALGDLASEVRQHLPGTIVAVTGSNGKTTVKRMIDHILSKKLKGYAGVKSYNNAVGVPLTLFAAGAHHDYVICEVGTNSPGEIAALTRIVHPDVAVITSVAAVHLEKLLDVEHVAIEKASLLAGLSPTGVAVVWADSDSLERALKVYDARMIRFGADETAQLRLTGYEPRLGGGRFEVNGRRWVDLPVPGEHNALNALAAIAVAQRFGFEQDEAAGALADYVGEEMRLEPIRAGTVLLVNDAYNANPSSLIAAVNALASFAGHRRVVVAGDMLELGPAGPELHRLAGERLAEMGVGLVVGVGELGKHIAEGAAADGAATEQMESVEIACEEVPKLLKSGDVVLIKASRAVRMERLAEPIQAAFRSAAGTAKRAARKGKVRK